MKLAALLIIAGLATVLAAMTAAWKRACLGMARTVFGVRFVGRLSPEDRSRFVPKFVSSRHKMTLFLMVVAGVVGGIFYGWLAGVGTFVSVWLLGEALAFLFPRPHHHYFVSQTIEDFREREALYARAGDDSAAADLRKRREQLEAHFGSRGEHG